MKNIVSFDTAKRLKEAGFPQPEYIDAGFCYDHNGELTYIRECSFPPGGAYGLTFAPTATDILEQLSDNMGLHYMVGLNDWRRSWQCICFSIFDHPEKYWFADGPAEAAALAFLSAKSADKIQRPDDFDELGE